MVNEHAGRFFSFAARARDSAVSGSDSLPAEVPSTLETRTATTLRQYTGRRLHTQRGQAICCWFQSLDTA
eukprot:1298372-Rhodomonas_salina.3